MAADREQADTDPETAAADAGLLYVSDQAPGIRRRRRGKGFSYEHDDGSAVGKRTVDRIRQLAVPPAWTDVWICEEPRGHLQATGRDARNRKQYRYHDDWRRIRDANKFDRLPAFGEALARIRPHVETAMQGSAPSHDRVLAVVVHLLDETLIRVGNAEYAADNETYGLTTLQDEHATMKKDRVRLRFVGKSGNEYEVDVRDPRVARLVRRCHELGGKELFTYRDDDGSPTPVTSADVNDYLRDLVDIEVSAKDYRTWGGTVTVAEALADLGPERTKKAREKRVVEAIDVAAEALGNTRTVCRNCYVHPGVVAAYEDESLFDVWKDARGSRWYSRPERSVLRLLG